jgi:hypothetical protein
MGTENLGETETITDAATKLHFHFDLMHGPELNGRVIASSVIHRQAATSYHWILKSGDYGTE